MGARNDHKTASTNAVYEPHPLIKTLTAPALAVAIVVLWVWDTREREIE